MRNWLFYAEAGNAALERAVEALEKQGFRFAGEPSDDVTHLLLPVPCRLTTEALCATLSRLPPNVTVMGGFLDRPELEGYARTDLLQDAQYQAENAMITAYCALRVAEAELPRIWSGCPVLVLGWGRIGKCLSRLLQALGAQVSVAARKESDRAMCAALGYDARDIGDLEGFLRRYRVIFNTVPFPTLSREQTDECRSDRLLVELASRPGMDADGVIDARGLPGKLAPESAGCLIARTVMRLCTRKEMAL